MSKGKNTDDVIGGDEFRVRGGYAPEGVELFVQRWIDGDARSRMGGEVLDINKWRSPASAYPRRGLGRARVRTAWYSPGFYDAYGQKGIGYFHAAKRLYITTLQIDGRTWMVDDPPHWWAMEYHAEKFRGHVVCAGLGLGLMVHAMTARSEIEKITVIERERDVIDLIAPLVPHEKLEMVHGDFWDHSLKTIPDVNGVFWDLFVGHGPLLVEAAVEVMSRIYYNWEDDPNFVARIHGVPNLLILTQMLSRTANVGTSAT